MRRVPLKKSKGSILLLHFAFIFLTMAAGNMCWFWLILVLTDIWKWIPSHMLVFSGWSGTWKNLSFLHLLMDAFLFSTSFHVTCSHWGQCDIQVWECEYHCFCMTCPWDFEFCFWFCAYRKCQKNKKNSLPCDMWSSCWDNLQMRISTLFAKSL